MTGYAPRKRAVVVGQATFIRIKEDRGYGGPWGQSRQPAKWQCVACGRIVDGTDERPYLSRSRWGGRPGRFNNACADNGHAPCRLCKKPLARLNCGCPREHNANVCPGKTAADRVYPTHASTTPHRTDAT